VIHRLTSGYHQIGEANGSWNDAFHGCFTGAHTSKPAALKSTDAKEGELSGLMDYYENRSTEKMEPIWRETSGREEEHPQLFCH
jgi:hypothetical protein